MCWWLRLLRSIKLKTLKAGGTLSKAHSVCVPNKLTKLRTFPLDPNEAGVIYYSRPTRDGKQKKERVRPRIVHAMWKAVSDATLKADVVAVAEEDVRPAATTTTRMSTTGRASARSDAQRRRHRTEPS